MAGMNMMVAFETVDSVENISLSQQNNLSFAIRDGVSRKKGRSWISSKQTGYCD